jgi:hypothetical protein
LFMGRTTLTGNLLGGFTHDAYNTFYRMVPPNAVGGFPVV